MLLNKRVERGMKWLRERSRRNENEDEIPVETGDTRAMIVSALVTILPAALLALLLIAGIPLLLFLL